MTSNFHLKLMIVGVACFWAFLIGGCTPSASSNNTNQTTTTSTTSTLSTNTPANAAFPGLDGEGAGKIIVVDPGHPSEVSSADGVQNGTTEVKMNWEVGLKLEQLISQDSTLKCVKTRSSFQETTTNRRRAEIANEAGAALMVRLHCDSGSGSGFTVYYPDRQGTAQGMTGPSQEVISGSRAAGQAMLEGLSQALQGRLNANPLKGDSVTAIGSKQGALTGSIFSKVPTITIEMVYLNNSADAGFIKSAEGQDLLAKGLFAGIQNYLKTK